MKDGFNYCDGKDIRAGLTTDIYFKRTDEVLRAHDLHGTRAWSDFTVGSLPNDWDWGIFGGLEEVLNLLKGKDIDVYALPEGTLFRAVDEKGVRIPVISLVGPYGEYCIYETPVLGLICQATGILTKTARIRKEAGKDVTILSFGIRRMHPALCPMLDYYAYMGGCDGVSSLAGADAIGQEPKGTMPHALVIVMGDQRKAFSAFHRLAKQKGIPVIALVDTYSDEKAETIMALESVGEDLIGVRLDTPSSRRGSMVEIVREIRWELNIRGRRDVKIFVSGGIDEHGIRELAEAGAAGFGVGTSITNARTVNFAMDIVEVEGRPVAKRGKFGGGKEIYRCPDCLRYLAVQRWEQRREAGEGVDCPACGKDTVPMLKQYMAKGRVLREPPSVDEKREYVLDEMGKLEKAAKRGRRGEPRK